MSLEMSHGQMVHKGIVGTSNFVKGFSIREGSNSYYTGTWEELETLVMEHFDNNEWGTGSQTGDVLLVTVPPEGFRTSIVEIDDTNRHLIEEVVRVRVEGEMPYMTQVIRKGMEKQPARFAKIVIYRADTLTLSGGKRSTDAEWEIVSVNAQNDEHTPMHPNTMLRNATESVGGTLRTYTQDEWAESYDYWKTHVSIEES